MTKEEKRVYMRNYQNERRARLKKEHKCVYCQKQDAFTLAGNVACEKCLDRQHARNKILYQKRHGGKEMSCNEVELREEIERLKVVNKLLELDVADKDKMLEGKVEEIYADFMRDYKCMREELEGLYDELTETRKELNIKIKMLNQANESKQKIFEDVYKLILENTYPDFDKNHKPVSIWKAISGYDALNELKKKYTVSKVSAEREG